MVAGFGFGGGAWVAWNLTVPNLRCQLDSLRGRSFFFSTSSSGNPSPASPLKCASVARQCATNIICTYFRHIALDVRPVMQPTKDDKGRVVFMNWLLGVAFDDSMSDGIKCNHGTSSAIPSLGRFNFPQLYIFDTVFRPSVPNFPIFV